MQRSTRVTEIGIKIHNAIGIPLLLGFGPELSRTGEGLGEVRRRSRIFRFQKFTLSGDASNGVLSFK